MRLPHKHEAATQLTARRKADLSLLPGLGGQMQDPEILVIWELFSTGVRELPSEKPQLSITRGTTAA